MNLAFSTEDLVIIAVQLIGFIITIITIKVDVKWIKQWCRDHKDEDERQFLDVKADIRDLRIEVRNP